MPQFSTGKPPSGLRRFYAALSDRWQYLYFAGKFNEAQERDFRTWYVHSMKGRVQRAIWLPALLVVLLMLGGGPFADIRHAIFGMQREWIVDALGLGFILPVNLIGFAIVYTRLYARWHSPAAQIVAPLNAIAIGAMDALMRPQGYSLIGWSVMTILGIYLAFGLLHHQAIRSAALALIGYVVVGALAGVTSPQWNFDCVVLALAAMAGAATHHTMHVATRRTYLETLSLHETARRDPLTGLYNRRMFDDHIARTWQQAARTDTPLGLLMIDMDFFKPFNDRLGHQAGDESLQKIAAVLKTVGRRPLDIVARYGGEEFAVLLHDARRADVDEICRELALRIAEAAVPHPVSPISRYVTASIGAACVRPVTTRNVAGFIQLADEALYAAKQRGRNRVVVMDQEYETLETGVFRKLSAAG